MSDSRSITCICPGPEGWEAWHQAEGGGWENLEKSPAGTLPWDLAAAKHPWIFGLPLQSLHTLALKIPAAEGASMDDVIPLRLEAAAMDSGADGVVLADWAAVGRAGESALVMAWTMEPGALSGCPANRLPVMVVPGFACWKWEPRALVFWLESGRWLAGFSGESFAVHVQPCVGTEDVARMADDLRGQAAALVLRGLTRPPEKIVICGDGAPFAGALGQALGLPVEHVADFPRVCPERSRLMPKEMLAARQGREEAGKWRKRIMVAAAVWLVLAGYGGWGYFQARSEWVAAKAMHEENTPKAKALQEIQSAWDQIIDVNGIDAFPLEVLARLSKTMPAADFRLTTFTVEGDRDVYLKGSAKRPDLALKFAQDLRRDKELASFTWETPYPVNEKDGTATFNYQGKFRRNSP